VEVQILSAAPLALASFLTPRSSPLYGEDMNVQNFPNVPNPTLPRIDYEDVFAVDLPPGPPLLAEAWARLVFRPTSMRDGLLLAAIGLTLGATRPAPAARGIGAFNVLEATDDAVLLETLTRVGLVQIAVARDRARLVLATFITYRGPRSRANFELVVKHGHRRAVPYLLDRAVQKAESRAPAPRARWTA
jgi:hypothetical protein